ncbi:carboxy terminal-processing peptidase [Perlucidibaca piscinae]|uniref:carboxy terminal-processing peptidase n=1 Tax=Perlucidibaca piscinae TaxID=392589 RepID=UPI0003B5D243|nr:carboxy terminal-processing peptidase [Perlucidibaca piscinae]
MRHLMSQTRMSESMPHTMRPFHPPVARGIHRSIKLAAAFASALATLPLMAAETPPLEPTAQQSQTTRLVARQLSVLHYNRLTLDDQMSQTIWTRYLDALDGQRIYFLAADIQAFSGNRTLFDNQIKAGQLNVAFAMFNRQQQRTRERLEFVLKELDTNQKALLDFSDNDSIENDRKDAPWVRSKAELDQLWRLRLKSAALSLRLADKTDAEIISTLKRRYKSQFTAISQSKPEDAFQLFMNAYTEIYDPHTQYLSPRNSDNFNINMSLQLEGIGAVLQTDDEFTKVVRLVPGGPADKSRQIKPNDRILAVAEGNKDFVDVVGWRIDEVVQLIRGAKNTTVRLQVQPAGADSGAVKTVSLVRNTVALEDQAASKRILDVTRNGQVRRVGVIKLPTFYADFQGMQSGDPDYRSTTRDVRKLLLELKQERVQGIVLDLRNNGGGSLTEVNDLLGEFISTGPTVQVRDARGRTETLGDGNPEVTWSGPLVVITNRLSASAAEIFAGAIQDYGRGLIVGSTTFGKGTVQSLRDLSYGQLKITEAKFYRISGASTQNKGVDPDIAFPELFDNKEIGESALDHALPWDTIKAARYARLGDLGARLTALQAASRLRQQRDPDMRYLLEQQKLLIDLKDQKTTSLNEKARLAEKTALDARRLGIENRRRQAKGQPLLKTWAELEEIQSKQNPESDPNFERPEERALAEEAAEILIDTLTPALTRATAKRSAPAVTSPARRPVVER